MIEGARGAAALRASGRLVEGSWWRTLGLIVLVNLVAVLVAVLLGAPFTAAANSTDRALWALIGQIVANADPTLRGALLDAALLRPARSASGRALG